MNKCPVQIKSNLNIESYQGIVSILDGYDVRNESGAELRKERSAYNQLVVLSLNGKPVISTVIYKGEMLGEDLIEMYCKMFGDDLDDLKAVSRHPASRKARDSRDCKREFLTDQLEVVYTDEDRYDNHVVSELLPNYSISLKEVLDF